MPTTQGLIPLLRAIASIVVMTTTAVAGATAPTGSFMGLGDLPGGRFAGIATGVSGDGRTVLGASASALDTESFLWTQEGGMVAFGDLPGGSHSSRVNGMSRDGAVLVGHTNSANGDFAFRWTASTGMVSLGVLPNGGGPWSTATATSSDGSVVVGISGTSSGNLEQAFRWTQSDGMQGLGYLSSIDPDSWANGVSADGTVIVGASYDLLSQRAIEWTPAGGMIALPYLPMSGGPPDSSANAASADGTAVVGYSYSNGQTQAFKWTQQGGIIRLRDSLGIFYNSWAQGVSADGSRVVGQGDAQGEGNLGTAWLWDVPHGMRKLRDVLINDFGVDMTGWKLLTAEAISEDGNVVVGQAINPNGDREAFRAVVPEPSSQLLVTLSIIVFGNRRIRKRARPAVLR